jgi:hypothetical protein
MIDSRTVDGSKGKIIGRSSTLDCLQTFDDPREGVPKQET